MRTLAVIVLAAALGAGPAACASRTAARAGDSSARGGQSAGPGLNGVLGTRWRVTEVSDAHGRLVVPTSLRPWVGFTRDGYVLGDDTVNALQGRWHPTADGYRLSDGAGTLAGYGGTDPQRLRVIAAVGLLFFTVDAPAGSSSEPTVELVLDSDTLTLRRAGVTMTLARDGRQPDFFAQSPSATPTVTPTD